MATAYKLWAFVGLCSITMLAVPSSSTLVADNNHFAAVLDDYFDYLYDEVANDDYNSYQYYTNLYNYYNEIIEDYWQFLWETYLDEMMTNWPTKSKVTPHPPKGWARSEIAHMMWYLFTGDTRDQYDNALYEHKIKTYEDIIAYGKDNLKTIIPNDKDVEALLHRAFVLLRARHDPHNQGPVWMIDPKDKDRVYALGKRLDDKGWNAIAVAKFGIVWPDMEKALKAGGIDWVWRIYVAGESMVEGILLPVIEKWDTKLKLSKEESMGVAMEHAKWLVKEAETFDTKVADMIQDRKGILLTDPKWTESPAVKKMCCGLWWLFENQLKRIGVKKVYQIWKQDKEYLVEIFTPKVQHIQKKLNEETLKIGTAKAIAKKHVEWLVTEAKNVDP